ncbi:MAG: tRNA uridine-5-carboxymethylaminomethyl(34) synthesis GTPase MnmE [Sphingomicrobium sp.]
MAAERSTIVALSSGRPPAAIAIIRLSGPDACAAATALAGPLPTPRHAGLRSIVDPATGGILDSALVLHFPAPASVTGEEIVELHCHGGRAVVEAVLRALFARPGVRLAEPGEFTRRALASGRIDLTEAEGLADLLAAETEIQRRAAQSRAGGQLRDLLAGWRTRLLDLSAAAEVVIDYPDEEDGIVAPSLAADLDSLAGDVRALLASPRVEPLRDGLRIVFAGPPNVGKSSLVNVLCKSERAIVTPIAGTTRDSIEVPLAIDGLPLLLVDTAGLRESSDSVERLGIARAEQEVDRADVLVWLGAPDEAPSHPRRILLHPKADLGPPSNASQLAVSAISGEGLAELLGAIAEATAGLIPSPRQLTLTEREAGHVSDLLGALEAAKAQSLALLIAEELRYGREAIDRITGLSSIDAVLDALFARFCLGK